MTNKKLIDGDDTMLALDLMLSALLVAPQSQLAHGRYVHNIWGKSASSSLFISRDTAYPPSLFWPRKPLLLIGHCSTDNLLNSENANLQLSNRKKTDITRS